MFYGVVDNLPRITAVIYYIVCADNISNIMVATSLLFLTHQLYILPIITPW